MAEGFDFFRQQAISLGMKDPSEIRDFIRQEQSIQTANLLKERDLTRRSEMEREDKEKDQPGNWKLKVRKLSLN